MSYTYVLQKSEFKVFNDSVHGHMEFHPLCVKIIDTPEFQRLRYIKQMGSTYFVYPGASHNRFEHSLGVCYLAGEMIDALRKNDISLQINETDKLCVQIAGLCHDLGHGPFSHLWEQFLREKGIQWHHEAQSVKMIDRLLTRKKIADEFEKYNLDKRKIQFIKDLILGKEDSCDENKQFLCQIVCNKTNGIDVDKWDYFLRDGLHLNLKVTFDYRRMLKFCQVKIKDGKQHIVFRSKEAYSIYEMFLLRSSLHYKACQHRVALVIDRMVTDALLAAADFYSITFIDNSKTEICKAHEDLEVWTGMTDHILHDIFYNNSNARRILERIQYRNLYMFITSKKLPTNAFERPNWKKDLQDLLNEKFKDIEFAVVQSKFSFGSDTIDPFESVYFYEKKSPDTLGMKSINDVALFPTSIELPHVEAFVYCKYPASDSMKKDAENIAHKFIDDLETDV